MDKPVLRVALAKNLEEAIRLIDDSVCDVAFYPLESDLTYAICTFQTENMLPKNERSPFEPMGNWMTAFPAYGGRLQRSFACLYKQWASYVEMVEQLREHFEVEEVKTK